MQGSNLASFVTRATLKLQNKPVLCTQKCSDQRKDSLIKNGPDSVFFRHFSPDSMNKMLVLRRLC